MALCLHRCDWISSWKTLHLPSKVLIYLSSGLCTEGLWTYHTPPAQQILQPLILLWTEQRAARILLTFLLRCSPHGLICSWTKSLKSFTRSERKKETPRESERSPLYYRWLVWTASIEFLFLVLTLSNSRQKLFTGNGQPHFFFFSIFILSPAAVCSCCFRSERKTS